MPTRRAHITRQSSHGQLAEALATLRTQYGVPQRFPAAALAEARTVAAEGPPPAALDLRRLPFVTLDPAGSRDLDQAFHIERDGDGFVLRYAIADVPGFVRPGGALDTEARERGQTFYLPDGSVPLHPKLLSEDRVSLLPDADRTAYVWTIGLDAGGAAAHEGGSTAPARVERALIRSRAKLDYAGSQRTLAAGRAEGSLALLPVLGALRIAQERVRGGANLNMPDEEVVRDPGGYRLVRRFPLPVEEWNAQLSLLTGMVAGRMMLDAGVGILRTMPAPDQAALAEFRVRVAALGLPWAEGVPYGEYLRSAPRDTPQGLAVLHAASSLFRGADYAAFGEPGDAVPEQPLQAAIAAPYAHVTAPLRRLVDRWGLVVCAAISAGEPVPGWARDSLTDLPSLMRASSGRAGQLTAAGLDRIEAALLRDRVGEVFEATVLEVRGTSARVQIEDPPVSARCSAEGLVAGQLAEVRVLRADVPSGEIELAAVRTTHPGTDPRRGFSATIQKSSYQG